MDNLGVSLELYLRKTILTCLLRCLESFCCYLTIKMGEEMAIAWNTNLEIDSFWLFRPFFHITNRISTISIMSRTKSENKILQDFCLNQKVEIPIQILATFFLGITNHLDFLSRGFLKPATTTTTVASVVDGRIQGH